MSSPNGNPLKFVSYNIQYSRGKDGAYELERIVEAVRGADIIALQEVTRNFTSHAPDTDQPGQIAALLPDFYWIYAPPVDLDASVRDAEGHIRNRRFQFGNMLLARWPILSSRLFLLPRVRTYDKANMQWGALEGVVDCPGGPLRVYCVHLNHLSSAERMAQIDFLLPKLLQVPHEGGTVSGAERPISTEFRSVPMSEDFVVLGDCNLTPDSLEYRRIVGEPDYYFGLSIMSQHLVDTWTQAGHQPDEGITWYDGSKNFQSGLRLDYAFVSAGLAHKVKGAWIDEKAVGSDHQPIWFELALRQIPALGLP